MQVFFNIYSVLVFLITPILSITSLYAKPMNPMGNLHKQTRNALETRAAKATTLHATGHYLGKKPSSSWITAHPGQHKLHE